MQSMKPIVKGLKPFGKDVGGHVVRAGLDQILPLLAECLVQPVNANAVRPTHVPHRRVLPRAAHLDHRSVVLMEHAKRLTLKNCIPEGQTLDTDHPEGHVRRNNLSLRSAVTDCGLFSGHCL